MFCGDILLCGRVSKYRKLRHSMRLAPRCLLACILCFSGTALKSLMTCRNCLTCPSSSGGAFSRLWASRGANCAAHELWRLSNGTRISSDAPQPRFILGVSCPSINPTHVSVTCTRSTRFHAAKSTLCVMHVHGASACFLSARRCSHAVSVPSVGTETEKRVATLNQPLADLRQRSLCRLLSHAWQDFAVGVQTNTHLVKCMLARRAWNMLFDAALRRRQLLEASAWHVSDLQRRCVWCWKDLLKERKRVAIMIGRFREDWTRMHAILGGKQMLESWSQQVQLERTREADLVNLLEYFNKDVQVALNCLADAFETWRLVITEV